MKKRELVLALVIVIVVGFVGSGIAAYFALRNSFADRMSFMLYARGMELSSQEAEQLERDLKSDPNSLADRIELLAYYSSKAIDGNLTSDELLNRREHILWIIEHEPSSRFASDFAASFAADNGLKDADGLRQAEELWLRQADKTPTDSRILFNAGKFFFWSEDWQESERLFEQAHKVDPGSFEIASSLATGYWHDARVASSSDARRKLAIRSFEAFKEALRLAHNDAERQRVLPDAARSAFEAGDYGSAAAWSTEMVKAAGGHNDDANFSDEIHYGNIVLGRLALQKGDNEGAGEHLIEAAKIVGNPHLDTFGPNMMLAKELLDKGDRKPVLEYFDSCGKFWKMGDEKLRLWRTEVAAGKAPDFGANLDY